MQVTVREGDDMLVHDLEAGSIGKDLFPKQSGMVAAVVNGVNVDLDTELREGDEVSGVHVSSGEGLAISICSNPLSQRICKKLRSRWC